MRCAEASSRRSAADSRRQAPRFMVAVLLLVAASSALFGQDLIFEDPAVFGAANRRFPQTATSDGLAVVAYQRLTAQSDTGGVIDIIVSTSRDGFEWQDMGAVISNISYEGQAVPPVYSLAVSDTGEILVAATDFRKTSEDTGALRVPVYRSRDEGRTFEFLGDAVSTTLPLVAPLLAQRADGGWFLFFEYVYEGSDSRFLFTRSEDGREWEELKALPIDNRILNQVDMAHSAAGGRDVLVFSGENFSALNAGLDADANPINPMPATFHLMSMFSDDGGVTWDAVDPATGQTFGGRSVVASGTLETSGAARGQAAGEELLTSVLPYWYLQVSDAGVPSAGVQEYGDIVSRRPDVLHRNGELYVVWEGGVRRDTDTTRQIVLSTMNATGNLSGTPVVLSARGLSRSRVEVAYNQPTLVSMDDGVVVLAYSDPSRRGDVVMYREGRFGWEQTTLSTSGISTFPAGLAAGGRLHVFWQQRATNDRAAVTSIMYLEPDQRAAPPTIRGVNFQIGRRSRSTVAELTWSTPRDPAGITGFSYVWSRDADAEVPTERTYDLSVTSATEAATEDGEWYFRIRAVDALGNWSEPATAVYFRDTTPPGLVKFLPPPLDEDGFLASNTFALRWSAPEDDVIGGYSYDLVYVASADADVNETDLPIPVPPAALLTSEGVVRERNFDDGLWALTVAAIDSVGNIGEPAVLYVRMNKYIPATEIWSVAALQDALGRYNLEIVGRGFTANGVIEQVVLDRDRQPPYDYVYDRTSEGFRVYNDRSMAGPVLDDMDTGSYWLGLMHPERGLEFAGRQLVLERNGTVKFGDFTVVQGPGFALRLPKYGFFGSVGALVWVVVVLLAAVIAFSATRIVAVTREGRLLRLDARALIASRPLPSAEQPERIAQMKRRGIGLRTKFAFFVVILIVAVVAMVAISLGNATLNNQRTILLQGMKDNVDVLMESITAGAAVLLPDPVINTVPLTALPQRTVAMDQALYATITGVATSATDEIPEGGYNYVWATNDPLIRDAGDPERLAEIAETRVAGGIERTPVMGPGEQLFSAGSTRVSDPVSELLDRRAEEINVAARAALGQTPLAIEARFRDIQEQIIAVATTRFQTQEEEDIARRALLRDQLVLAALNDQVRSTLRGITGEVQSYPEFDPETFTIDQRDFIFYQPITYLESELISGAESLQSARYFHGAVRIAVSTDQIVEQISEARLAIIRITSLIAIAAVAAGIIGALLLSALVVSPIRKLARGVEIIRDTVDKKTLVNHVITLRSRDELSALADTVNEMTAGLVQAARADEELKVSSDMQKMFMPLAEVAAGNEMRRLTTAQKDLPNTEFHGYYEGADALSGDYFSYESIDEKHYALIKCDVSGHGVEAAIIMVEVATIFLNQLRDWRAKVKPPRLTELLGTINDLVVEREFKGKFAAMTVAILDVDTGELRVSHAGDNLLQIYRAATGQIEKRVLEEVPATGVFPQYMFPPGMGYDEVTTQLQHGDILIMATDGIDESKRVVRNRDFEPVVVSQDQFLELCREQGWGDRDGAEELGILRDDESGTVTEDLTLKRMHEVIEKVQTGGTYALERAMNPLPDERLEFNFKRVKPTAESAVLGLMSVEKILRIVPDPAATERDMVRVDRKIDEFLREHFSLYARYFRYQVPEEQRPDKTRDEYVWFSHLKEDNQKDDLTILAIRKK